MHIKRAIVHAPHARAASPLQPLFVLDESFHFVNAWSIRLVAGRIGEPLVLPQPLAQERGWLHVAEAALLAEPLAKAASLAALRLWPLW